MNATNKQTYAGEDGGTPEGTIDDFASGTTITVPTVTKAVANSSRAVMHPENFSSLRLPEQGSREEIAMWNADRQKVMNYLQMNAELYTDMTLVSGLETVSHAGNVEGGRTTGLMVKNPVRRFMVSVAYPLGNYMSELDKDRMSKVLKRARDYHVRLGITYTNHKPRECYGEDLFRQTYNYLMVQPWFLMDQALRRDGKQGVPADVLQAALRVAAISARRLNVQGIGGETVEDVQSSIDSYAETEMFEDNETSASRRLGIQMAYSMVEALIHKLPSNRLTETMYHTHYKIMGLTGSTFVLLPAYEKLGIQGLQKAIGMTSSYKKSAVHQRLLKNILTMIPEAVHRKLMIPEIVASVLDGGNFETFAKDHLANFETALDPKWGHHLTFPMDDPREQK